MNIKKYGVIFTILLVVLLSIFSCKAEISAPSPTTYLTFSSNKEFSITPSNDWQGGPNSALEVSTDNKVWEKLDKLKPNTKKALKAGDSYYLYFKGTDNNKIGNGDGIINEPWIIQGTDVSCIGNIETLLDYKMVIEGKHPNGSLLFC